MVAEVAGQMVQINSSRMRAKGELPCDSRLCNFGVTVHRAVHRYMVLQFESGFAIKVRLYVQVIAIISAIPSIFTCN